jgi:succinate-semialdehyde dehydrogenase / glutarate-semialdehyde dehydrogenase
MDPELLIDGEKRTAETLVPIYAPATGQVIGNAPSASLGQARDAIAAADRATAGWAGLGPRERAELLEGVARQIQGRRESIATVLSGETGKRLSEAHAEISLSVEFLRWYAGEARRANGLVISSPVPDKRLSVIACPRGVAGLLIPWNFPVSILIRKLAAALAAGCAVVARPSSVAPLAVLALSDSFLAAGIPPGVVNLISGTVRATAEPILDDPRVRTVSFTGSTEVGRLVARRVVSRLGHVTLELGGDAPFLVFDDADLDDAVDQALVAKLRNNGQSCIAMNRLYVQEGIADRFLGELESRLRATILGDPLDQRTTLGPVISKVAADRLAGWIDNASGKNSTVIQGPRGPSGISTFVRPTIVVNPQRRSELNTQEVFGPVVGARIFKTDDEGVELAGRSARGLAAYVATRDMGRASLAVGHLRVGIIGINDASPTTPEAPFGGLGDSGWGKEGGHLGLEEYLDSTFVSVRSGRPGPDRLKTA